jgi:hypothetical protein
VEVRFASGRTGASPVADPEVGGTMPRRDDPASAPDVRGLYDPSRARASARTRVAQPPVPPPRERPTLERFRELRERADEAVDAAAAKAIVRELKAVGGDLRAVRRALTGRERGPELWAVVAALSREETLRRVDGAL